ncbi:hypothetical protein M5K25_027376 [Dendrobium thyrsiflorum]|uniref:Uncharacterized protein n=1 Tax=Dendrobium thyrsiflorum TaxID=117978 RepID=A0ABD0TZW1_DENTH
MVIKSSEWVLYCTKEASRGTLKIHTIVHDILQGRRKRTSTVHIGQRDSRFKLIFPVASGKLQHYDHPDQYQQLSSCAIHLRNPEENDPDSWNLPHFSSDKYGNAGDFGEDISRRFWRVLQADRPFLFSLKTAGHFGPSRIQRDFSLPWMANPEYDHGFVYDHQGLADVLQSPFFYVDPEIDETVEEYLDRILFALTTAIEQRHLAVQWKVTQHPPTSSYSGNLLLARNLSVYYLINKKVRYAKRNTHFQMESSCTNHKGHPTKLTVLYAQ